MGDLLFFPLADYWWFYGGFTVFVLLLLALDLGVFHREAHEVDFKEAATWSVVWMALALAFNYGFYLYALNKFPSDQRLAGMPGFDPAAAARQVGLEFLTGYIVEKSLAVDNIFVFVVVFTFFSIPRKYQHRVLFYGIIGALIFRAIFIGLGSVLMQYKWIVIIFGVFLILTGVKMFFAPEKGIDLEKNPVIRLFKRFVPVTPQLHGQNFFVRLEGRLFATPLFVSLLFLALVAPTTSTQLIATNLTGHPAVILPHGFRDDGTPASITFLGNLYGEAKMLAVARAYQEATDFHRRHPKLEGLQPTPEAK